MGITWLEISAECSISCSQPKCDNPCYKYLRGNAINLSQYQSTTVMHNVTHPDKLDGPDAYVIHRCCMYNIHRQALT